MSYWSHNVEKMDEIIAENLPPIWKVLFMNEEVTLDDIPNDVKDEAFRRGEADYWGGLIDNARERRRGEQKK